MTDSELIYLLFSTLVTFCFIYPPKEFEGAGVTIPNLFGRFFPEQFTSFIQYHIVRTLTTFVVYASLPFFFMLLGYTQFSGHEPTTVPWSYGVSWSLILPTLAGFVALSWHYDNWNRHPIVRLLKSFNPDWLQLAEELNMEYRSAERIEIKLNSISTLVITENWIIKTLPFMVHLARLNEVEMVADRTDVHAVNEYGRDAVQYLNVRVTPINRGRGFSVRLKSTDFREIQEKLARRIILDPSVQLELPLMERFVVAFETLIAQNPKYSINVTAHNFDEACFACTIAEPNIKIHKNCLDVDELGADLPQEDRCMSCNCKPMWCSGCLARWFATRQDADHETWFEKKSSCPMCRARFCILDVSFIQKNS